MSEKRIAIREEIKNSQESLIAPEKCMANKDDNKNNMKDALK